MFKINSVYIENNKNSIEKLPPTRFLNFLSQNFAQFTQIKEVNDLEKLEKARNRLLLIESSICSNQSALEMIENLALKNADSIYIVLITNRYQNSSNDNNENNENLNSERIVGMIDHNWSDEYLLKSLQHIISIIKILNSYQKLKEKEKSYLAESEKLVEVNVNNAMLIAEIEQKNKLIALAKRDIQNLQDNLDEGFMLIDNKGTILPQWSKAIIKLFNCDTPEGKNIFDLLEYDEIKKQTQLTWLESLFSEEISFSDLKELGPKNYFNTIKNIYIELDYRVIRNEHNKIEKLIVIAVDHTMEIELQEQIKRDAEWTRAILGAMSDRDGFKDFLEQTTEQISEIEKMLSPGHFDKDHCFRLAHSIKGNAGLMHLLALFNSAKELENQLHLIDNTTHTNDDEEKNSGLKALTEPLEKLKMTYQETLDNMNAINSEIIHGKKSKNFDGDQLESWYTLLTNNLGKDHILAQDFKNYFILDDFHSMFPKYSNLIEGLSEKFFKNISYLLENFTIPIVSDAYKPFVNSLVHIFRNSIDHGIETPEERLALNKPEVGQIKVSAKQASNQLILAIEDDGKGINPELLRKKLLEKNILQQEKLSTLSDPEIIQYIFHPGFSTKEVVSDISGRGVGLDAVRYECEKLKGSITVESITGKGTKFIFVLPLLQN
ncbi:MAG: Hpt domain-containing protein [Oligoflexia bacterium]|nr:Hpt domain-containing protein [Oligoflexia bacterium]